MFIIAKLYTLQIAHHFIAVLANDLWKYEVNENTWTWLSGGNPSDRRGKYGEKGKASVENIPAGRTDAVGFYDSSTQEFWLFGGTPDREAGESRTYRYYITRL